jgi:hypothetical protein
MAPLQVGRRAVARPVELARRSVVNRDHDHHRPRVGHDTERMSTSSASTEHLNERHQSASAPNRTKPKCQRHTKDCTMAERVHQDTSRNCNGAAHQRAHHQPASKTRLHARQPDCGAVACETTFGCCCCCLECKVGRDQSPRLARNESNANQTKLVPSHRSTRDTAMCNSSPSGTCGLAQECRCSSQTAAKAAPVTACVQSTGCRRCSSTNGAPQEVLPHNTVLANNRSRLTCAGGGQDGRTSTSCSDSDRMKEDDNDNDNDDDDEAEVSSVTTTSSADETGRHGGGKAAADRRLDGPKSRRLSSSDSWSSSLLSLKNAAAANGCSRLEARPAGERAEGRQLSSASIEANNKSSLGLWTANSDVSVRTRRGPAPLPPNTTGHHQHRQQHRPQSAKTRSQSVAHLSRRVEPSSSYAQNIDNSHYGGDDHDHHHHDDSNSNDHDMAEPNGLLSDQEVHCIEHFLKSHKSSVYVCGCMANLYFTKTHLADNGRASKASANEWKLNKTGVPVLIFDSGLTRNRNKRRLSISLAERGSGFVLWSDTIDHLSDYRAFSARLHSIDGSGPEQTAGADDTCDSFHVMYLSSNHRIMVGLSFDNATCARLFLAQVELVCADPANIALTGPKARATAATRPAEAAPANVTCRLGGRGQSQADDTFEGPQLAVGPAPVPMMGKLLASFKRARGCARRQPRPSASPLQAPSSWSTLKRAALRIGSGQQQQQQQQQQRLTAAAAAKPELASRSVANQRLLLTFRPRPLAQLAAEGRVWHKFKRGHARRLPRKCDISAPCLFQHVTSVDLTNLDQLYSSSFVASKRSAQHDDEESSASTGQCPPGAQADGQQRGQRQAQEQQVIPAAARGHALDGRAKATVLSLSSSSSCYSSASSDSSPRSPSGSTSECDGGTGLFTQQRQPTAAAPQRQQRGREELCSGPSHQGGAMTRGDSRGGLASAAANIACPRPSVPPPKPPQRSDSRTTGPGAGMGPDYRHAAREPVGAASEQTTQIRSIIKELQAQVPGELVQAKRRLMADIAGQVLLSRAGRRRADQPQPQPQRQEQQKQREQQQQPAVPPPAAKQPAVPPTVSRL